MQPIAIIEATAATRRAVSGAGPRAAVLPGPQPRAARQLQPKRFGLGFLRLARAAR
jgi:hypothetical protein